MAASTMLRAQAIAPRAVGIPAEAIVLHVAIAPRARVTARLAAIPAVVAPEVVAAIMAEAAAVIPAAARVEAEVAAVPEAVEAEVTLAGTGGSREIHPA